MQVYNILSQQYHSPVVPTSSSNMSTSMGTCFKHPSSKTWRMPCLNINLDISGFPDHIQSVGIHFAQGCIAAQQKALLNSTGSQHAPFRFMTWGANILNNRLSLFVVHEKRQTPPVSRKHHHSGPTASSVGLCKYIYIYIISTKVHIL